jgi:hypothetical protein
MFTVSEAFDFIVANRVWILAGVICLAVLWRTVRRCPRRARTDAAYEAWIAAMQAALLAEEQGGDAPDGTPAPDAVQWFGCGTRRDTSGGCCRCGGPRVADAELPRYLLLPCRCEWDGCGDDGSGRGRPLERYATASDTVGAPKCGGCSAAVAEVIDLHHLFVEVDGTAAVNIDSARSFGRAHSAVIDAPDCCICMSEASCVVVGPCCHVACCTDCGHRIASEPARQRNAVTGRGEVVSRCPLCRVTITAMTVLDDEQRDAAVAAAKSH